ncbi:MAG: ribonuclease HII [Candidatus Pacebacteria bacterium]|nr:ribonuclease HII [Candidatus Paceibacterota bacterium]MDD2757509.1 ribonuclease HII [Candidatus Paceibacterota bacterium]MDD3283964.1 ribonuclease HII [Candidatus Paceibacterota bacterium]MDD3969939.1 ribonuclease HII [Candidatus Paceibacterota bacterium]MDD4737730.1 ribonuclease HII [Candidatus Paceibacterota bacterium]
MPKESKNIIGIDEAGRGPLSGPVVAAAVLDSPKRIKGVKDSKLLNEKKREELYLEIVNSYKWGIGIVSPKRIDKINILEATKEAMIKAVRNLEKKNKLKAHHLILDGNMGINIEISQESIIKADRKIYCVSAASIIAKVTRDRLMIKYDKLYPEYNFKKHKGYGTREHFKLIKKHGGCEMHRKSFKPFDKDK